MRKAAMLTEADHESVVLATGTVGDALQLKKNLSCKPQQVGSAASEENGNASHISSADMPLK